MYDVVSKDAEHTEMLHWNRDRACFRPPEDGGRAKSHAAISRDHRPGNVAAPPTSRQLMRRMTVRYLPAS